MNIKIKKYDENDLEKMLKIWNSVVEAGNAFPQNESLTQESGRDFFGEQTYCGVAVNEDNNEIVGLYILHPNNVGRCGHICNASYAVDESIRGHGVGRALVTDCMMRGKEHGFKILQFNAVVKTNFSARHLYKSLGFTELGIIPGGFLTKDGVYEDIVPYYCVL